MVFLLIPAPNFWAGGDWVVERFDEERRNRLHREQPQPKYDEKLRERLRSVRADARGAT